MPNNSNKDYYYIIRDTNPAESVLVEYGFLDSNKDDQKQIINNWDKWAEAVVKATADYKGYNYSKPNSKPNIMTYIVKNGDSLWSIAKMFNISVDELKYANKLDSNLIIIGQSLIIPKNNDYETTNLTYIVQKDDTLWSIANSNNTTIDEIINLNDLGNNIIYVGQVLKLPNKKDENFNNNNLYVVKPGDTLWSIANTYGLSINDIRYANNLSSDFLSIGQTLLIPFKK